MEGEASTWREREREETEDIREISGREGLKLTEISEIFHKRGRDKRGDDGKGGHQGRDYLDRKA